MITMEHVCKSYKVAKRNAGMKEACKALFRREVETIHALSDVSFTIEDGEMVGYIGPNGAGKSSTIKILSGILTPENGSCLVDGRIPWKHRKEHVRRIGVVFGQRSQLWWDVPVIDSFALLKDIYSISPQEYRNNMEELTQLLHLQELLKMPVRQLSLGQRMRCEIAASLLHSPRILFLDEPTSGLDPESAHNVNQMILALAKDKGMTIFLCTHQLRYAQEICTRYGLIDEGRLLIAGTLEELRAGVNSGLQVRIRTDRMPDALAGRQEGRPGMRTDVQDIILEIGSEEEIPYIVSRIVESGGRVYHVSAKQPSLEDIYFVLTAEQKGTEGIRA